MTTSPTTLQQERVAEDLAYRLLQDNIAAARDRIKGAFYATMFIGGVTGIICFGSLSQGGGVLLFDVAIIFGLGYGIYRYNTNCAVLMFGYFVISKIIQLATLISNPRQVGGVILAIVLIRYLWGGVIGTQEYHRLMAEKNLYESRLTRIADNQQPAAPPPKEEESKEINKDLPVEPDAPTAPPVTNSTTSEALTPSAALLSMCNGDRVEAQWLLSQIKRKHPDESVQWCNEAAITQLMKKRK